MPQKRLQIFELNAILTFISIGKKPKSHIEKMQGLIRVYKERHSYTPSCPTLLGLVRVCKWWVARRIGSDTKLNLGWT
jgi:hypothetical protein